MPLTDEQRERISAIFTRFLARRVRSLERLTLAHLKFNVLALRGTATMLELDSPEALLRYRLAQHLERSLVTAMGTVLQTVAKEIAGQGSGVAGADIEKVRAGRRYFIQVKSGPDTANKDIAQNIAALLNSAGARDPEAICLLGVCYGRPDQISAIAHSEMQARGVALLVGQEFWEFIGEDPSTMPELLELAGGGRLAVALQRFDAYSSLIGGFGCVKGLAGGLPQVMITFCNAERALSFGRLPWLRGDADSRLDA